MLAINQTCPGMGNAPKWTPNALIVDRLDKGTGLRVKNGITDVRPRT
ncbi:MAG: hypothetical protein HRF42_10330 [Candidatus Brocadia sp.]